MCVCVCERERETERQRDRETERREILWVHGRGRETKIGSRDVGFRGRTRIRNIC